MNQRARIDGKIVDVLPSVEEAYNNPDIYKNNTTAIKVENSVYPLRGVTDDRPGIYRMGEYVSIVKLADEQDLEKYSSDLIIDFDNIKNIREAIDKHSQLRHEERYILETPDHLTVPNISPTCTQQMKCLKEAIISKQIDFDKYEQRFGSNFNNDKRLLEKDDITLNKLITICQALDIKVSLTLEDMTNDVPNPIGRSISSELTSGGNSDVD